MNTTWLYGIAVRSAFPLFATPTPAVAAPGVHAALDLQPVDPLSGSGPGHIGNSDSFCEQLSFDFTHGRQLTLYADSPLESRCPDKRWYLQVDAVVRFHWHSSSNVVCYEYLEQGNQELLVFWFVHIFLPMYLTLERDYDFLHAAAVEVAGAPVLFVAPSTGGKSTFAEHFLQQGHAFFSDDKVATFLHEGQYWVVPSHPHHRPWREFEVLGQPVANVARHARPLRAVYRLLADEPDADIAIDAIKGFRKVETLLPNYLFSFDYLQARRLRWLASMTEATPMYAVQRPWNLQRLHETYLAVCAHAAASPTL